MEEVIENDTTGTIQHNLHSLIPHRALLEMDREADPMADLSPEQANTLLSFSDITQIQDMNLSRSILAQNSWNLDVAVENFINNRSGDATAATQDSDERVDSASTQSDGGEGGGVLSIITAPLRWLFQTTPMSISPDQDATQFVDEFHLKYTRGDAAHGLNMERTSYAQAVRKAHRESKFLLVYLHSPLHDDTNRFCSEVLCSDSVLRLVNGDPEPCGDENDNSPPSQDSASSSQVLAWGGRVWDPEAYNLSIDLSAASFPFLALLVCQSDRSVQILDRIHGYIDQQNLAERLQHSITAARTQIDRIRNEQIMRSSEANLRMEQDREYLEAMEADRQQQLQAQRERERKEREEQEEAQRVELEKALALSNQLSREADLAKKRASLQRATPSGPDSALIRFQLPQGSKVTQTFWKTDLVQTVYDFLSVHFADKDIPIQNFMVSTNFPKKDLTDKSLTVEDVGLHPRGALFVHNLDS